MTDQPIGEYADIYGPGIPVLPSHPEDVAAHERRFPAAGSPHHAEMPEGVPPVAGSTDDAEISGAELRI